MILPTIIVLVVAVAIAATLHAFPSRIDCVDRSAGWEFSGDVCVVRRVGSSRRRQG